MDWSSYYNVGVKSIDVEHHNIVKMITKLENSLRDGLITEQTGIVLKDLVDYTKYHFTSEENYMQLIQFPEFEHHKELHKELIISVIDILKQLKEGKSFTSADLIDFLIKWLNVHIIDEDKKIGEYMAELNNNAKKDIEI